MRTTAILFALLVAALLPAPGAAQSASPLDAAQIDNVLTQAHAAAGGAQLDGFAMVTQSGTFVQNGGPPSNFDSVTNLRNGYTRGGLVVGPAKFQQGYDGTEWTEANGVLSIVSLPSFVADAVTQAYLSSNAFFRADQRSTIATAEKATLDGNPVYVLHVEPRGGSPADLYFDASSYRLVRTVAQTAQGRETTTNSDFQTIQGVTLAMHSVDVDASSTTTTTTLSLVKFDTEVDSSALARPPYVSRGTLAAPASIPFATDVMGTIGHIIVPVSLDGKEATLVFDSGGANFLVPAAVKRLGLQASGGIATGGAGTKEQMSSFASVSTVDFGGARLSKQVFLVTPLLYAILHPRKGIAPEGLIGFEYLANFRIAVRYADRRVVVTTFDQPAPAGGVTVPFKSDGRHAFVLATVDGVSGYYLLDTGNAGGIVLNDPFVKANHLFPNGGLVYQAPGGVGGGFAQRLLAAKSFTLAGETFRDVPVSIPQVNAGSFATRGVAGNLGSGFLSRFTVVFDYKDATVTFIPNRNLRVPFRSDRTGMSLNQTDSSAFDVTKVVPGSPAAAVGIVAGDRITAFAGKRVAAGYGLGDLRPYLSGDVPFTLSVAHGGASKFVRITPRSLLPAAQ